MMLDGDGDRRAQPRRGARHHDRGGEGSRSGCRRDRAENTTLASALLADSSLTAVLDPEQAILLVIFDSSKALQAARSRSIFSGHAFVQHCHRHKERNVCDLLPEREHETVHGHVCAPRGRSPIPDLAEQRLGLLASELKRSWPDAAGSLRQGHERHADPDTPSDHWTAREDALPPPTPLRER